MAVHRQPRPETEPPDKPDWSAIVAHQLKAPLCALDARLSQGGQVNRGSVRRDIRKMTHLIDQLQTLALCRGPVARTECGVGEVAREVCKELLPLAIQKDQRMTFRDLSGGRRIALNEGLAREALSNVVENAIKYSGQGAWINVVVLPGGAVCVLDRGPGVEGPDREGLFEPFRRGQAVRGSAGTGLGLHIVSEIMALHGGEVSHRNRRTGGSAFALRFTST